MAMGSDHHEVRRIPPDASEELFERAAKSEVRNGFRDLPPDFGQQLVHQESCPAAGFILQVAQGPDLGHDVTVGGGAGCGFDGMEQLQVGAHGFRDLHGNLHHGGSEVGKIDGTEDGFHGLGFSSVRVADSFGASVPIHRAAEFLPAAP